MTMKIKHKLIGAFLIVAVVPIVAMMFVNNSMMSDAIYSDYTQKGKEDTERAAHYSIPKMIENAKNYVHFMSLDANLVKASYYANTLDSKDELKTLLSEFKGELGLSVAELTDMDGKITVSDDPSRIGVKVGNASIIKAAASGNQETRFEFDKDLNSLVVHTAALVERKGKAVGLLYGAYVFDDAMLSSIMGKVNAILYDSEGHVAAKTGVAPGDTDFVVSAFDAAVSACKNSTKNNACHEFEFGVSSQTVEGVPYLFISSPIVLTTDLPVASLVLAQNETEIRSKLDDARNVILLFGLVFTIAAGLIGLVSTRGIIRPLENLKAMIRDIAEGGGDLTQRLNMKSKDEVGELAHWFDTFVAKLQAMIKDVGSITLPLNDASKELDSVAHSTGDNVVRQKDQISTVATAMTEMVATAQESAQNAEIAAQATSQADQEAQKGTQIVGQSIVSINQLASEVGRAADVIQQLEKDTDSVATVLDVIKGIAEQTNLLALNAAIEAARAGEQGRGFAVVADEVRTLAQRTQESTLEIQNIIEQLQSRAKEAVRVMESGKEQTSSSVEQAKEANETFVRIAKAIASVTDMTTQIASAAEEQSSVAEDINADVVKISQMADQTAEDSKKTAASSGKLDTLASKLDSAVSRFKV